MYEIVEHLRLRYIGIIDQFCFYADTSIIQPHIRHIGINLILPLQFKPVRIAALIRFGIPRNIIALINFHGKLRHPAILGWKN